MTEEVEGMEAVKRGEERGARGGGRLMEGAGGGEGEEA